MEKVLKFFAFPFTFLAKKGGFSTLAGYIAAAYVFAALQQQQLQGLRPVLNFLNSDASGLFTGLALWATFSVILFLLVSRAAFKKFNSPTLNIISCILLGTIMILAHWKIAAAVLLLLALLWLAGQLGGYETIFDYVGDTNPWDGRFATSQEMRGYGLKQEEGIILGIEKNGKRHPKDFICYTGEGNTICFAPVGKGKTSGPVISNALYYKGSMVINDPKGEITATSLYNRANLFDQTVMIIDPFGELNAQIKHKLKKIDRIISRLQGSYSREHTIHQLRQAERFYNSILPRIDPVNGDLIKGINPMQVVNQLFAAGEYDQIYAEANVLADILVVKNGSDKDPHWDDKAKMIIRNAILFVTFSEVYEDEPKTLVTVREFILRAFSSEEVLQTVIEQCHASDYALYLTHIAGEFSLIGGEERNGVLSNALKHTEFLDDPYVKRSVARDDCNLRSIKEEPTTVYLILPLTKIAAYSRLSRLWVATIVQTLMHDLDEPEHRVLLMLDEAAQLGHLEPLEKGISYLRQYGVNMYLIFQDLAQLKGIYGNKWETILANCRYKQFLGASDQTTAEYVSKETGQKTLVTKGNSYSEGSSKGHGGSTSSKNEGFSTNVQAAPVLRPDEVRRSPFQYIIPDEGFPIEAARLQYFSDELLRDATPFNLDKEYKDI